jgi:hypothetical protein
MAEINIENTAIERDDGIYNKINQTIPKPEQEIGIDTKNTFIDYIIDSLDDPTKPSVQKSTTIDMSVINKFTQVSQERNTLYNMLDTMCEDSIIAAVLETYAEDATERNDDGRIV